LTTWKGEREAVVMGMEVRMGKGKGRLRREGFLDWKLELELVSLC